VYYFVDSNDKVCIFSCGHDNFDVYSSFKLDNLQTLLFLDSRMLCRLPWWVVECSGTKYETHNRRQK